MDLDEVGDLMAAWRRFPPPSVALHSLTALVASALGSDRG